MKTLGFTAFILAAALAACSDNSDVAPVPNVPGPEDPPPVEFPAPVEPAPVDPGLADPAPVDPPVTRDASVPAPVAQ